MKFVLALSVSAITASAVSLTEEVKVEEPVTVNAAEESPKVEASPYGHQASWDGKPSFGIGDHYREPDYSQEYGEVLPGADFNKQVY